MNQLQGKGENMNDSSDGRTASQERDEALERIHVALRGLRFGTVTVVVQDGLVVQVERTEKIRVQKRQPRALS